MGKQSKQNGTTRSFSKFAREGFAAFPGLLRETRFFHKKTALQIDKGKEGLYNKR